MAALVSDAAQLLIGRPVTSAGVFATPALRDKPEAKLWQGAAAALAGHADEALRAFEIGKPALAAYPPNFRSFLGLLAMQAAIDSDALDAARSYETISPTAPRAGRSRHAGGPHRPAADEGRERRSGPAAPAGGRALARHETADHARLALIGPDRARAS
jgi:hypothetical protein